MNRIYILALGVLLVAACSKKSDPSLSGPTSTAGFTYVVKQTPGGDSLPFTSSVAFTNTSVDAFTYLWDFGDGNTSIDLNPVKVYNDAKVYDVKLLSIGKGGNNSAQQRVTIDGSCGFAPFDSLTGCSNHKWSISPAGDAIKTFQPDGTTLIFASGPTNCQGDDIFTLYATGAFDYDAKGKTQVGNTCGTAVQNVKKYVMLKNAGGNPKIVLMPDTSSQTPFLGIAEAVVDNSYEVISVTSGQLVIQGTLSNGNKRRVTLLNGFDINTIKTILTGGSSRTWRLDSTDGAKPIVVGKESSPTEYYAGGALQSCQKDDWVTFRADGTLSVETNGGTVIPTAGFSCGPVPNVDAPYTFGPIVGGAAGLAQIGLAPNNAAQWIGVLDRAPENVYRILSIDSDNLLLRSGAGTPAGTIHTFKFVRK